MMSVSAYEQRRGRLETYFDRTALEAWAQLTSDAPVSRIRATVREGRDQMRSLLLSWLPASLENARLLDAGCGTGALAVEAALRGAEVVAVDVAANLIEIARDRAPAGAGRRIAFAVGDMLDPAHGRFDHAVMMDSLIHYPTPEIVAAVRRLASRTERSILFTIAPRTPALAAMHAAGRLFPRRDRAPALQPIDARDLARRLAEAPELGGWRIARTERVSRGFYTSQALELVRT